MKCLNYKSFLSSKKSLSTTTTTSSCSLFSKCNSNNNNNNNIISNSSKIYNNSIYNGLSYRSFISTQINSLDIDFIKKQPSNIGEVNSYLSELSSHSPFASENIRISFLSAEREIRSIKGLKLYGFNTERSWLVIVGGKEPNQWSTISLCLYLGALFSYQPLDNLDILLFPIENPTLYTTANHVLPASLASHQHQLSIPLESTYEITSPSSSSSFSTNNNNKKDNYEYIANSKRVSSVVFNDWLKRSKKQFQTLSVELDSQLKPNISLTSESTRPNPLISEFDNLIMGSSGINRHKQRKNYILEIKDINLNLPDSKVLNIAENIRDELKYLSYNI